MQTHWSSARQKKCEERDALHHLDSRLVYFFEKVEVLFCHLAPPLSFFPIIAILSIRQTTTVQQQLTATMVIQRSTVIAFCCCLFAVVGSVQGQNDWGAQTTATWQDAIAALEAVADDISAYTTDGESDAPSMVPSDQPSMAPSDAPSMVPSDMPSMDPSKYGMEEEEPKQYMACRPGELYSQSDSDVELVVNYKYELQLDKRGGETDGLDNDSIKPYVTEIEQTVLDTMIPSICSNGGDGVLAASKHPTDQIYGKQRRFALSNLVSVPPSTNRILT